MYDGQCTFETLFILGGMNWFAHGIICGNRMHMVISYHIVTCISSSFM